MIEKRVYTIKTGRFETGTEEQQKLFMELFGKEKVQYQFDFYFHWYNIVHEYGHCLCDYYNSDVVGLKQELLVNRFAVSFWSYAGYHKELQDLAEMVHGILQKMKSPVPDGLSFIRYYEQIWGTDKIMEVPIYGYFQFKSVLMALEDRKGLADVLEEMGIEGSLDGNVYPYRKYPISVETAQAVLEHLQLFLDGIGMKRPKVNLELVDEPFVQCAAIS